MNKEFTEFLEKLAAKLGTTAEYLWKVLIIQAKVSAIKSLIFIVTVYIIGLVLAKFHIKYLKKISDNKYDDRNTYESSEVTSVVMCILFVGWVVLFIGHIFSYSNMINGFFNPEYWALNKILDQ